MGARVRSAAMEGSGQVSVEGVSGEVNGEGRLGEVSGEGKLG